MAAGEDDSDLAPREAIAHAVREDILAGRLVPGDRLREEDLARRFEVSRVPIREALSQLHSEGFVTLVRYRGATVSDTAGAAARELVQVRRGLEVLAAQLAAERGGGEVADELRQVVALGRDTAAHEELPSLIVRFHTLVAQASGNHQLQVMLGQILRRVQWIFDQQLEARTAGSWGDHAAIAQAILSRSPIQAGYLMGEHIAKDEALVETLRNR
ncbi:GntR family transcriptional regulator [Nocardia blacklockiae]|uniref:GntR family transcriptional regulator n=1 Tax=Nocardia blacklockiae TaxID=480036 RepID=UPI00189364E9|nr:GntR family transcriptional regulator [Nocardia blacklockiae]MBF6172051.1 GntR family transcriptional regulator [Nocardia blacklockiae]